MGREQPHPEKARDEQPYMGNKPRTNGVLGAVPPQNGRFQTEAESRRAFVDAPFCIFLLSSGIGKGNSLAMHLSEARLLSTHPVHKKKKR